MSPLAIARIAIFYSCVACTSAYAIWRGGAPERWAVAMLFLAAVATSSVSRPGWSHLAVEILMIDVALLLGLVVLALTADRFWPTYFAAVQLLTVSIHLVRAHDPQILPAVYAHLAGMLAYPTLVILAIGTRRHVLRGEEIAWSWERGQ